MIKAWDYLSILWLYCQMDVGEFGRADVVIGPYGVWRAVKKLPRVFPGQCDQAMNLAAAVVKRV